MAFNFNNFSKESYKIIKPIRLIELFAGIGAQAKALEKLKVDFEHYRICEFDKYAIKSYNAVHNTSFEVSDIVSIEGKDLGITNTDKYEYIMTYSFPCQSLSVAGLGHGMEKGSGTRSSLLWEVERLLSEIEEKPQVLVMENVMQVHSEKNLKAFNNWLNFLKGLGYNNFYKDLNAKNFGIAQNRKRCFMVSVLSDKIYNFPNGWELDSKLGDYLDKDIPEKYYINRPFHITNNTKSESEIARIDDINYNQRSIVNDPNKICPCLDTMGGGNREPKVLETQKDGTYRIRKLTPKECWRLMGFTDEDFEKAREFNSDSQLYKQAGNSIVVNVLQEIFRELIL